MRNHNTGSTQTATLFSIRSRSTRAVILHPLLIPGLAISNLEVDCTFSKCSKVDNPSLYKVAKLIELSSLSTSSIFCTLQCMISIHDVVPHLARGSTIHFCN